MGDAAQLHHHLFSIQSPAARQYFELRKDQCFRPESGKIRVLVDDPTIVEGELDSEGCRVISRSEDLYQFSEIIQGRKTTFFINQPSSRGFLDTSLTLFMTLLAVCKISEQILDFLCCFGLLNGERELSPPPVRFRWLNLGLSDSNAAAFDLTYIVRFVELNHRNEYNPWSLRQTLVFHRLSTSSTFIFVALSDVMKQLLRPAMELGPQVQTCHPLGIHLILIKAAAATWRNYLVYIAEEVKKLSQHAEVADLEDDGVYISERDERQHLHELGTWVTDIATSVDSSLDLCSTLRMKNTELELRVASVQPDAGKVQKTGIFLDGLLETERDLEHHRRQAELMHVKIRSTATLLTNILDLDNGHALRILALEASQENAAMKDLTKKGAKDAEAVKVLTIVTLVYLPTTAVLNFFSTSFVDFSSKPNGSSQLRIADNWWISVAVALPLTVLTLYIWQCYVRAFVYNKPPLWPDILSRCARRFPRLPRKNTELPGRHDNEPSVVNASQYS